MLLHFFLAVYLIGTILYVLIMDTLFIRNQLTVKNKNGDDFIMDLMFRVGRDSVTRFADMQVYTAIPKRGDEYTKVGELDNNLLETRLLYYHWLTGEYDELWNSFSQSNQFPDRQSMYQYLTFSKVLLGTPSGKFGFLRSNETMDHIETIYYQCSTLKGQKENSFVIETVMNPGKSEFHRIMYRNLGPIR